MSNKNLASKIKLASVDDLFGLTDQISDTGYEQGVVEINLSDLYEFENHPFRVNKEKVSEMAESIKQFGVLVPGICRVRPMGGYEIIAGHTRKAACEMAGLLTMPMVVKNLSDDDATIVMIDTNIQREDISVSEKAKAYKMRYDAIKHQGAKGNGLLLMSDETGESQKQIQRYMYLTRLLDEFLEMVDNKKLPMRQAVDISFLQKSSQELLLDIIKELKMIPNMEQTAKLKVLEKDNAFNREMLLSLLVPVKKIKRGKITLKADKLREYFDESFNEDMITDVIYKLLDDWKKGGV